MPSRSRIYIQTCFGGDVTFANLFRRVALQQESLYTLLQYVADITWEAGANTRRVNLDEVTKEDVQEWKTGETVLLSGKILTGRDAAHKRIQGMLESGEGLPAGVDFKGKFIYYVGPVDAVGDEAVGPAGPTTSTRMDKFTDMMLNETGIMGMIGKAERGPATVESIKEHKAVYLMAVGGAAYLVAKAIKKARVVAFRKASMIRRPGKQNKEGILAEVAHRSEEHTSELQSR